MKTIITIIFLTLNCLTFGQIRSKIISLDSTKLSVNYNQLSVNDEIQLIKGNYHFYDIDYLTTNLDSFSFDYSHGDNQYVSFYFNYIYKTCYGKPIFIDNERLKLIAKKEDSLYRIQLFDPANRIIFEGHSMTLFPFNWVGKMIEYYPTGKVRAESIYNNEYEQTSLWSSDGIKIDTLFDDFNVDSKPNFINYKTNFEDSLTRYIQMNISYPRIAIDIGFVGAVYTTYVITKTGKVDCIRILRGIHPVIDNICIDLLKGLPTLHPAYVNNKPVNVRYSRTFRFTLN